MRSVRSMIGLPVLMDGKRIGHITHVELDQTKEELKYLYFGGAITGERRVGKEDVLLLGQVSTLVRTKGQRKRHPTDALCRALLSDGSRVGAVTGAMIDEESMSVAALEITRGYLDDLISGRKWVFRYTVNPISRDVLIVPEGGNGE